ncbi:transglycosylase family protein [Nesterenkonia sphaerica]|uniref:transglycosylase family protein n=1 Tax=Nesterenkonia sphaerica TaxID=1804988 RepID=UPI001FB71272|nr:transglycosylase family protein [Nesterenkonia sphaerica]
MRSAPSSSSSGSSTASSGSSTSSSSSTSGSTGSGSGSTSGRTGPTSGQHAQSAHGPYSSAWDRLAQCESSGNWSINTGNGYFGGLQFSESSWRWVGGSGLPHQASKQEQIERAYQLWQRQGWGAWPACSQRLGLSGNPGGWGNSYFNIHAVTQTSSATTSAGQWRATYSVPLREEPSSSADKLAQIPRGEVLRTGERRGSWVQVEHDGAVGWVNTAYVMSV